jgi:predicted nucleic acid-binding protein
MNGGSFLDTNVLGYTDDQRAPGKQEQALALVERLRREGTAVVSTQVLQEYFVTATRKLGVPVDAARRKVEIFSRMDLVVVGQEDILAAIDLHAAHQTSFWDALLLRAASRSGCSVLYTEDLQHGQRFGDLEVINPFLAVG